MEFSSRPIVQIMRNDETSSSHLWCAWYFNSEMDTNLSLILLYTSAEVKIATNT